MSQGRPRFEPVEHTADVGIRAFGLTLPELFENAALGLFETITDLSRIAAEQAITVEIDAADLEDLLVQWLSELNFIFQTKGILLGRFAVGAVAEAGSGSEVPPAGWRLRAEVAGQAYDPTRHEIRADVKAVTFHDLVIRKGEDEWEARVIFDV